MSIEDNKHYGELFKFYRNRSGKTQKEVCDYLNVTQSTLSKYETGLLEPPFDILLKMKNLYNVSIDVLLGATSKKDLFNRVLKYESSKDITKLINDPKLSNDEIFKILEENLLKKK